MAQIVTKLPVQVSTKKVGQDEQAMLLLAA